MLKVGLQEQAWRACRSSDDVARDAAVVKALVKQILVSLRRLHRMGIVHRDVKPVRKHPKEQHPAVDAPDCLPPAQLARWQWTQP